MAAALVYTRTNTCAGLRPASPTFNRPAQRITRSYPGNELLAALRLSGCAIEDTSDACPHGSYSGSRLPASRRYVCGLHDGCDFFRPGPYWVADSSGRAGMYRRQSPPQNANQSDHRHSALKASGLGPLKPRRPPISAVGGWLTVGTFLRESTRKRHDAGSCHAGVDEFARFAGSGGQPQASSVQERLCLQTD